MMGTFTMPNTIRPPYSLLNLCNSSNVKNTHVNVLSCPIPAAISSFSARQNVDDRSLNPWNPCKSLDSFIKPLLAVGSGLEASISDENVIKVKNANVVVELQDDDKMQVKVELSGEDTQIVFDEVLTNLARTAPPVPGFRRQKGGKTSKVPKSFLLSIIGEDRVTKFVIQEILTSTIADYVTKENLTVKDNKIETVQTEKELQSSFNPGSDFVFNVILELEKSDTQASNSSSSEA